MVSASSSIESRADEYTRISRVLRDFNTKKTYFLMASILAIIIRECINRWIIMLFTNLQQIKFLKHYIVQSVLLFSKFLEFLSAIFWVMHWIHILQEDKGLAMVPFDPITGFRWQIENGSPSITVLFSLIFS